ncbi:MAG: hypothetical protein KDE55_01045 [Novosphingobium sp.]|nr:hypothetical protein [Novosphingobium sp.]
MRNMMLFIAAVLAFSSSAAYADHHAGGAEEAATPKYSVASSDIGTLLDNPATKAVLDKHIPSFSANPQIAMARAMTLKQIQGFASDMLTDDALAKIDADLARIK